MIPTTSQRTMVNTARRLATTQQIRRLSHATMGFDEIAEWKRYKHMASDPRHQSRTGTIFDLKVYSPINKSNTWNISYASGEADNEFQNVAQGQTPLPSPKRFRTHSRHFATVAAGQTTTTNMAKPKAESPIRLPVANMFSSLATDTKPIEPTSSSVFCSERQATEITDVPGLDVLAKLRAEKLPQEESNLSESQTHGNASNNDDIPVTELEKLDQLRSPSKEEEDIFFTARGPPVWYP